MSSCIKSSSSEGFSASSGWPMQRVLHISVQRWANAYPSNSIKRVEPPPDGQSSSSYGHFFADEKHKMCVCGDFFECPGSLEGSLRSGAAVGEWIAQQTSEQKRI